MASAAVPVAVANGAARRRRGRRATGGGGGAKLATTAVATEARTAAKTGNGFGVRVAPPLSRLLVAHLGARTGGRTRAGEGGAVSAGLVRGRRVGAVHALCACSGVWGRGVGRGAGAERTLPWAARLEPPGPAKGSVRWGGAHPTIRPLFGDQRRSGQPGRTIPQATGARSGRTGTLPVAPQRASRGNGQHRHRARRRAAAPLTTCAREGASRGVHEAMRSVRAGVRIEKHYLSAG